MKRHYSQKDSRTGYEMILSECSYNEACEWLSTELAKYDCEIWRTEKHTNGLMWIWSSAKDVDSPFVAQRMFYYDEERGYLLGE